MESYRAGSPDRCRSYSSLSVLQPHFKAGSIPDLACELLLLPGRLVTSLFQDRGASPEFQWHSLIATAILL